MLHLLSIGLQQELGGIVEEDAKAAVAELVAQAVFVGVVHPLADPQDRGSGRILSII